MGTGAITTHHVLLRTGVAGGQLQAYYLFGHLSLASRAVTECFHFISLGYDTRSGTEQFLKRIFIRLAGHLSGYVATTSSVYKSGDP